MNTDKKFAFVVLGIPLIGLLYCGLGLVIMGTSDTVRNHPVVSGTIFILFPFLTAVYTWISASAKAYKK